jgi:ubiquinone/menaquinone biosynthesis C-methylase UbiE
VLTKRMAKELSHPSSLVGRWILAPLWNKRNSALNDVALDRLDLHSQDRVLEVGFGGGYLLGRMATQVTRGFLAGVDVSSAMVAASQQKHRALIQAGKLELKCAKAEALPYPSAHFTKACTVNSIFYWEDAPRAILELGRVLQADGRLVMCFTCKESMQDKEFARHGVALYEAEQVEQMMAAGGLRTVTTTRHADRHREFWCIMGGK